MRRWILSAVLVCTISLGWANTDPNDTSAVKTTLEDDRIVAAMDSLLRAPYFEAFAPASFDSATLQAKGINLDSVPVFSEEVYRERLQALDAQTPFDLVYNDRVKAFIHLYAVKRREQTSRVLGLQYQYFPMIEEVLDKYQMPYELKYLAVVESALNPKARSHAGAVGLWQFIYSTGKMYGMLQNSYMDERMDPVKSTEAACRYLQFLYSIYGKWDLALAAYNCGPGNVNRAMRRAGNKDGNYWDLYPYLPRETRGYVPAFIAVNYVMNYSEEHHLVPVEPLMTFFETDTVHVQGQVTFAYLSEKLGVEMDVLRFLNPTYTRNVVPAYSNETSILRLPAEKAGSFVYNEEAIYAENKPAPHDENKVKKFEEDRIYYRVRSGDYLGKIAQRHRVSVSSLKRWNNLSSNNIRVGQRLVIYPNGSRYAQSKPAPQKTKPVEVQEGNKTYYKIQPGDTLWDIAKARGMSVDELKRLNSHLNSRSLKPGMKIVVASNG